VLTELPQDWAKQVAVWRRILRAALGDVEGTAPPDPNDELLACRVARRLTRRGGPRRLCRAHQGALGKSLREDYEGLLAEGDGAGRGLRLLAQAGGCGRAGGGGALNAATLFREMPAVVFVRTE
jgi:hypothetical protein